MFFGREVHLKTLNQLYTDDKADLVLVYGRRRVGKSRLVTEFLTDKKNVFHFIGLEPFGENEEATTRTAAQITNFLATLARQTANPLIGKLNLDTWEECFSLLTQNMPKKNIPCCLFFDELPWMACQRLELIRALFKYWETDWSGRPRLMLIVCGSSVGFLEKQFIRSSLFYGRATHHIHLHPWRLREVKKFFGNSRNADEVLNLYMHLGGIPRYLELVSRGDSVKKAVSHLCFSSDSFFMPEISTLFRSSFIRESPKYHAVVRLLRKHKYLDYATLAEKTNSVKGSSFRHVIDNLVNADLVGTATPFDRLKNTNLVKYYLSDEFLGFYLQFMEPHADLIRSQSGTNDLYDIILPERKLFSWKGHVFEKMMVKHASDIAEALGLQKVVVHHGLFSSGQGRDSCQIDLVFLRTDKTITACEIKYSENPIGMTRVIALQLKKQRDWLKQKYKSKRIETVLVTNAPVSENVLRSDLVQNVVRVGDLL